MPFGNETCQSMIGILLSVTVEWCLLCWQLSTSSATSILLCTCLHYSGGRCIGKFDAVRISDKSSFLSYIYSFKYLLSHCREYPVLGMNIWVDENLWGASRVATKTEVCDLVCESLTYSPSWTPDGASAGAAASDAQDVCSCVLTTPLLACSHNLGCHFVP